ncbi:hypothetical protein SEA_C3PO_90 [Corynebacterium phage C3PO]|uniref:Uncharacterized protein n=2 Tax=Corynebacterium virus C3PO TaxID=2560393 RepID=A0A3G3LWG8_9CAUD|nr:hypothetical protein FDJ10_gp53 [Corynebacterium phage C3PO]ATW58498.1 hypothetical protein SEA_C3PO_90 [Corynebacterium phage C3PO]AYQ98387.1 hypothetical protein CRUELLA_91 [Corynebacterium phage Cruella]
MEKNFYNVGNIYGVYTAWDEWDSQTHWDTCVEDLKNMGAVLISNERYGGEVGAEDVFKDWQDCMEDIDRSELEIEDLKSELTDPTNDIQLLADELVGRVEELQNGRDNFGRFKLIEGYNYNLLIDMDRYVECTGKRATDEELQEMLREYTASALGELETVKVVEIDKCPDWLEEIEYLAGVECEERGGFGMTTNYENIFEGRLVQFLMDQGLPLGKRHKLTKVGQ